MLICKWFLTLDFRPLTYKLTVAQHIAATVHNYDTASLPLCTFMALHNPYCGTYLRLQNDVETEFVCLKCVFGRDHKKLTQHAGKSYTNKP
jgi:hypothetical protein